MFAGMADYYVRQIKIAKHFYTSQYNQIDRAAKKAIKKNQFGAITDMYLRSLYTEDMAPFETESGRALVQYITSIVTVEAKETPNGKQFFLSINKSKIDSTKNELDIQKASIEYEKARQMLYIHNNNAIISLLIRFENFFTDYFEWLISKFPNKYLNEKSIKYAELLKYDFENLKKELSTEAANAIMSQPLGDWIKIIKSHKFDIQSLASYLNDFAEIYYRRNIIVHNNGKVNRQYLTGTKCTEADHPLGEKLVTNKPYVLNAFDVSMVIVYGLLFASIKGQQDEKEEYLDFLFSSGFDHMMDADWNVSAYIFDLLKSDTTQTEHTLALSQINYWISLKNLGRFSEIKEEILSKDYSAMNSSIQMAKEILLENYENAIPLLEVSLPHHLSHKHVETWPLFIQFRKTPYYDEFRKKYAKELESQVIDPDDLGDICEETKEEGLQDLKHAFKEEVAQPTESP